MNKVNIKVWKDFLISKLFRIESPATRSIREYNLGDVPYVSSGSVNNGIVSYLEPKEGELLEEGNCITVSPLDGSAFYQEDDFLGRGGAGSAISKLYNHNLSKYNALFICTIIKVSSRKFDYSDALTGDNLEKLVIKLPVLHADNGEIFFDENQTYSDEGYVPDWEYMANYMQKMENKAQDRIDLLRSISI